MSASEDDDVDPLKSDNPEIRHGYRILTELMADNLSHYNGPFMDPVDVKFIGYSDMIKEPIWLRKMEDKFLEGSYECLAEFVCDLRLMLINCYRYNGIDSRMTKVAAHLETLFEQKLMLLPKEMRSRCSLAVTLGDGPLPGQKTVPSEIDASSDIANTPASHPRRRAANHRVLFGGGLHDAAPMLTLAKELFSASDAPCPPSQSQPTSSDGSFTPTSNGVDSELDRRQAELVARLTALQRRREEARLLEEWPEFEAKWMTRHHRLVLQHSPEVVQSVQFLRLAAPILCLSLDDITVSAVEWALIMPRESRLLAYIINTLFTRSSSRQAMFKKPALYYRQWERKVRQRVSFWYRLSGNSVAAAAAAATLVGHLPQGSSSKSSRIGDEPRVDAWEKVPSATRKYGVDVEFFRVMGWRNPLEIRRFHELSLYQRVCVLKALIDSSLWSQESFTVALDTANIDWSATRETVLGKHGDWIFIHWRSFMDNEGRLRIYRMRDPKLPPPEVRTTEDIMREEGWAEELPDAKETNNNIIEEMKNEVDLNEDKVKENIALSDGLKMESVDSEAGKIDSQTKETDPSVLYDKHREEKETNKIEMKQESGGCKNEGSNEASDDGKFKMRTINVDESMDVDDPSNTAMVKDMEVDRETEKEKEKESEIAVKTEANDEFDYVVEKKSVDENSVLQDKEEEGVTKEDGRVVTNELDKISKEVVTKNDTQAVDTDKNDVKISEENCIRKDNLDVNTATADGETSVLINDEEHENLSINDKVDKDQDDDNMSVGELQIELGREEDRDATSETEKGKSCDILEKDNNSSHDDNEEVTANAILKDESGNENEVTASTDEIKSEVTRNTDEIGNEVTANNDDINSGETEKTSEEKKEVEQNEGLEPKLQNKIQNKENENVTISKAIDVKTECNTVEKKVNGHSLSKVNDVIVIADDDDDEEEEELTKQSIADDETEKTPDSQSDTAEKTPDSQSLLEDDEDDDESDSQSIFEAIYAPDISGPNPQLFQLAAASVDELEKLITDLKQELDTMSPVDPNKMVGVSGRTRGKTKKAKAKAPPPVDEDFLERKNDLTQLVEALEKLRDEWKEATAAANDVLRATRLRMRRDVLHYNEKLDNASVATPKKNGNSKSSMPATVSSQTIRFDSADECESSRTNAPPTSVGGSEEDASMSRLSSGQVTPSGQRTPGSKEDDDEYEEFKNSCQVQETALSGVSTRRKKYALVDFMTARRERGAAKRKAREIALATPPPKRLHEEFLATKKVPISPQKSSPPRVINVPPPVRPVKQQPLITPPVQPQAQPIQAVPQSPTVAAPAPVVLIVQAPVAPLMQQPTFLLLSAPTPPPPTNYTMVPANAQLVAASSHTYPSSTACVTITTNKDGLPAPATPAPTVCTDVGSATPRRAIQAKPTAYVSPQMQPPPVITPAPVVAPPANPGKVTLFQVSGQLFNKDAQPVRVENGIVCPLPTGSIDEGLMRTAAAMIREESRRSSNQPQSTEVSSTVSSTVPINSALHSNNTVVESSDSTVT